MNENMRLRDQDPWKQIVEKVVEDAYYDQVHADLTEQFGVWDENGTLIGW